MKSTSTTPTTKAWNFSITTSYLQYEPTQNARFSRNDFNRLPTHIAGFRPNKSNQKSLRVRSGGPHARPMITEACCNQPVLAPFNQAINEEEGSAGSQRNRL